MDTIDKKSSLLLFLFLTIFFTGCSMFQGKRGINMQPFSDNAGILFGEAVKISRPYQFKSLVTYTDNEQFQLSKERSLPLIKTLKGIVYYSNQIVVIHNSRLTDKQKNEQLAVYLKEVFEKARMHREKQEGRVDSLDLNMDDAKYVLDDIRSSETYLDGIAAASPIINTIVLAIFDKLDDLEEDVSSIISIFEAQINSDYAHMMENYDRIKELQKTTQEALSKLYLAQIEGDIVLDSLYDIDQSLSLYFDSDNNISQVEFKNAEQYLYKRGENINIMLTHLDDDKKGFLDKKEEVRQWQIQADEKINIARNAMIIWSQSHRNLGSGIDIPPLIGISSIMEVIAPTVGRIIP